MPKLPNLEIESYYYPGTVAGIDEAGRGPLAGCVVAAAVIVDAANIIENINDSKKLSPKAREILYEKIAANYIWSVGIVPHEEIDEINILRATQKACLMAEASLETSPSVVLVDGNMKFPDPRFKSLVKGDSISLSIAAASIIAKVTRDRMMKELDKEFPHYLWSKNMGYGTKKHIEAIKKYGPSPYHRKSFIKKFI